MAKEHNIPNNLASETESTSSSNTDSSDFETFDLVIIYY